MTDIYRLINITDTDILNLIPVFHEETGAEFIDSTGLAQVYRHRHEFIGWVLNKVADKDFAEEYNIENTDAIVYDPMFNVSIYSDAEGTIEYTLTYNLDYINEKLNTKEEIVEYLALVDDSKFEYEFVLASEYHCVKLGVEEVNLCIDF